MLRYTDIDGKNKTVIDDESIWNLMYPVGSIYWTMDKRSPKELFPSSIDWEWVQLEGFIYSLPSSSSLQPGDTGGSDEFRISISNMPSHNHGIQHKHSRGTMNITGKTGYTNRYKGTTKSEGCFTEESYTEDGHKKGGTDTYAREVFDASKTWQGLTSDPDKTTSTTVGGGKPIRYMPPYTAAYCWMRTK